MPSRDGTLDGLLDSRSVGSTDDIGCGVTEGQPDGSVEMTGPGDGNVEVDDDGLSDGIELDRARTEGRSDGFALD